MKLLSDLLYKTNILEVVGSTNVAIAAVCSDSRKVEKFSLFVAVKGTQTDSHKYIGQCIDAGAVAIVCEEIPSDINSKVTYVKVKDSSLALGLIASNFYDNPSSQLKLVGVTGTNGKTTTVTLLFNLFQKLGYKTGLLSTVKNQINKEVIPSTHTTPDAVQLNALLRQMVDGGCTHCFMEVSSHAVVQNRISGVTFSVAAFTNITHDHLDYHGTFDNYIKAKKGFFDNLSSDCIALVNADDRNSRIMIQNTKAIRKTYALQSAADFKCKIMESQLNGMMLQLDGKEIWTSLIGTFNAYNLLLAYSVAIILKEEKMNVLTVLSDLQPVEGRFQYVTSDNGIIGIVDYAHTPDALKNVLNTIKTLRTGNETLITVVGCGGDRDALKRPVMAEIACASSDKIILTSDNPRSEDPEQIISDMKKGVDPTCYKKVLSIVDRREAIKTACSLAKKGDIILVAGKGHEKYQEIKGVRHPFDDVKELKEAFEMLTK